LAEEKETGVATIATPVFCMVAYSLLLVSLVVVLVVVLADLSFSGSFGSFLALLGVAVEDLALLSVT